jgi:hypothetical protein
MEIYVIYVIQIAIPAQEHPQAALLVLGLKELHSMEQFASALYSSILVQAPPRALAVILAALPAQQVQNMHARVAVRVTSDFIIAPY